MAKQFLHYLLRALRGGRRITSHSYRRKKVQFPSSKPYANYIAQVRDRICGFKYSGTVSFEPGRFDSCNRSGEADQNLATALLSRRAWLTALSSMRSLAEK